MRRYFNISVIILVYILCSAKGCDSTDDRVDQARLIATRDSITRQFQQASPGDEALRSFEIAAGQKLRDVADYLNILSDPGLAKSFRKKAAEMLSRNFRSPDDHLAFSCPGSNSVKEITTKAAKQVLTEKTILTIDSIRITSPLQRVNDSCYAGELSFVYFCAKDTVSSRETRSKTLSSIAFYALKQEKSFGKKSLKVWEVRLGGMPEIHLSSGE